MSEKRRIQIFRREVTSSPELLAEQDVAQDPGESTLQAAVSDPGESSLHERSNTKEQCPQISKPYSLGSQEQGEAITSCSESQKPPSPHSVESPLSVEGAVGGGNLELGNSSSTDSAIREQNKYASVPDKSANPGELDLFNRLLNEHLQFPTRPDSGRLHRAGRLLYYSEGYRPESERRSSGENQRYLQTIAPLQEPLLNQAGAVVGIKSQDTCLRLSEGNNPLSGSSYVADSDHSIGSAETVPIEEVYSEIFSPFTSPQVLDREVPPSSSLPSLQTIEPLPEPLLNQAGAVVGVQATGLRLSEGNNPLPDFGYVADSEHSIGSAETVPIEEVYSGVFSPFRSPQVSDRMSPGSSFPSLQTIEPLPEPLLNQAGAAVGVQATILRLSEGNNSLSGFGYEADFEHSIGSTETVPIAEVYSGIFSPFRSSQVPGRGVSPGTSSDGTERESPVSTDSESLQKERSVRRRRRACSEAVDVPQRCESALAGSEGSYSEEQDRMISTRKSRSKGVRKMSRVSSESDHDEYLIQKTASDSEDDEVNYPELSHSLESDHSLPIPDITERISELEQGLSNVGVSDSRPHTEPVTEERDRGVSYDSRPQTDPVTEERDRGVSDDSRPQTEPATEERDGEDPLSALGCSSGASENLVQQSDDKDK